MRGDGRALPLEGHVRRGGRGALPAPSPPPRRLRRRRRRARTAIKGAAALPDGRPALAAAAARPGGDDTAHAAAPRRRAGRLLTGSRLPASVSAALPPARAAPRASTFPRAVGCIPAARRPRTCRALRRRRSLLPGGPSLPPGQKTAASTRDPGSSLAESEPRGGSGSKVKGRRAAGGSGAAVRGETRAPRAAAFPQGRARLRPRPRCPLSRL